LFQRFRLRADPKVNVIGFSVMSHVRAIPGKVRLTVEVGDFGTASVELVSPDQLTSKVIEQLVRSLTDISFKSLDLNISVNRSKEAKAKEDDFWPSEDATSVDTSSASPTAPTLPGNPESERLRAAIEALLKSGGLKSPQTAEAFPPFGSDSSTEHPATGQAPSASPAIPAANEGSYRLSTALERDTCVLRFTPSRGGESIVLRLATSISSELLESECRGQKGAWRFGLYFEVSPPSTYLWSEHDSSKLIFLGDGSDVQPIRLDRNQLNAVFGDESFLDAYVGKRDGKDPLVQKGQPDYVRTLLMALVNQKNGALLGVRRNKELLILTIRAATRREIHMISTNGSSFVIGSERPEFSFLEARPEHKFFDFIGSLLKSNGEVVGVGLTPKQERIYVSGRWQCPQRRQQEGCVVWASDAAVTTPLRVIAKGVGPSANLALSAFAASANSDFIETAPSDVWLGPDISIAARGLGDPSWAVFPIRFDYSLKSLRTGQPIAGSTVEQRYSRWRSQAKASSSTRPTLRAEDDRRWLIEQIVRGSRWDRSAFQANPVGLLLND
jgi:hypothetical protein